MLDQCELALVPVDGVFPWWKWLANSYEPNRNCLPFRKILFAMSNSGDRPSIWWFDEEVLSRGRWQTIVAVSEMQLGPMETTPTKIVQFFRRITATFK